MPYNFATRKVEHQILLQEAHSSTKGSTRLVMSQNLPDFNLLAASTSTLAKELGKIPNMPSLSNQSLVSIQQTLTNIQQSLVVIQQNQITMQQSLNAILHNKVVTHNQDKGEVGGPGKRKREREQEPTAQPNADVLQGALKKHKERGQLPEKIPRELRGLY